MGTVQRTDWPAWWSWEIALCSHLVKRMVDRCFSEVDLRSMMETATNIREDQVFGRWVVETSHESRPWEVIVEPDFRAHLLIVITAYSVEST